MTQLDRITLATKCYGFLIGLLLCAVAFVGGQTLGLGCAGAQKVAADVCKASGGLVTTIDAILGDEEYEQELSKVSATLCALVDGVEQAATGAKARMSSLSTGDQASLKRQRALAWLAKHGPVSMSLPGGGGVPHCCYRPGFYTAKTPACGNGELVTPENVVRYCSVGCIDGLRC